MASERKTATNRAWYERNKAEQLAANKARREADPEKYARIAKNTHLLAKFNMTIEQYEQMFERQGGVCAICGRPPKKHALHVDHCHKTGKVRGLLCFSCNGALGWFEKLAAKILKYLSETG
jgi:hypothetical protein